MTDYELINIDSEDIEDLLVKVETSFDIKFIGDELVHITTFGQLCDHIANKIQLVLQTSKRNFIDTSNRRYNNLDRLSSC